MDGLTDKIQTTRSNLITMAFVAKAAILVWMALHGFPRNTGDAIIYQQPAVMFLSSGNFSLPTAEGWLPYADQLYAGNTPLYTLVSLAVFWLFGFSYQSCLWLDLVIHLLTTGCVVLVFRRLGANAVTSAMFVILSSFLFLPRGRPEELGVLCGICALLYLLTARTPRLSVPAVLLGLSVSSHITTGIVATTLFFVFLGRRSLSNKRAFFKSARFVVIIQMLTVVVSFVPFFWGDPEHALQQFIYHSTHHYRPDLFTMLAHLPSFSVFLCAAFLIAGAFSFSPINSWIRRQHNWRETDALGLMNVWVVLVVLLLCLTRSQPNHFRFVAYILLGLCTVQVFSEAYKAFLPWRNWIAAVVIIASLIANEEIIRYVLVPFTWKGDDTQTYAEAVTLIETLVPSNARVGGDGVGWEMVRNGNPYLSFPWYRGQRLPDYLLSTTFWGCGGEPRLFLNPAMKSFVAERYEVIRLPRQTGCELSLFGVQIPISRSACDWRVSVWKLKSH